MHAVYVRDALLTDTYSGRLPKETILVSNQDYRTSRNVTSTRGIGRALDRNSRALPAPSSLISAHLVSTLVATIVSRIDCARDRVAVFCKWNVRRDTTDIAGHHLRRVSESNNESRVSRARFIASSPRPPEKIGSIYRVSRKYLATSRST